MRQEYEIDDEIEIVMEVNKGNGRHSLRSSKSKFFPSKMCKKSRCERMPKNNNGPLLRGDRSIRSLKKRKLRPKTFWQLHDLK